MNGYLDFKKSLHKMRNLKEGKVSSNDEIVNVNEGRTKNKTLSIRELLGRVRKLKEQDDDVMEKTITPLDKKKEKEKLQNSFSDLEVNVVLEDFEVYDTGVFLSGSVDDQITFTFSVTPSEDSSGIEWTATEDFDTQNPDNENVIKRLESYYKEFYEFWRDNELQL